MSRKGSLKVLLDTSFLLPMVGFETDREIMDVIPLLRRCEVFYSDLSILELLWKIAKLVGSESELEIVVRGIELVRRSFARVGIDEKAVEIAIKLYRAGHRDLVDNLLYGVSVSQGLRFLSIDRTLRRFVVENGFVDTFLSPRELKEMFEGVESAS